MRILVTGGAGFIGSHLTERLLQGGHQVVVLDDLSSGSLHNLAAVMDHPRLRFSHESAGNPEVVEALMAGCDRVFHLAAMVGVRRTLTAGWGDFEADLRATHTITEAACRHRCGVIYASSSEVYGRSEQLPFREDQAVRVRPGVPARWRYAWFKASGEQRVFDACQRGLPFAAVVRLFNTAGPRQAEAQGMVLPRLCAQALRGESLTVYGDGHQTRCFVHVQDVVDALMRLLAGPEVHGQILNIGSSDEVAILQLAERVLAGAGTGAGVRLIPYDTAYTAGFEEVPRRVPCLQRAHRLLGWQPRRGLDEIIRDVLAHTSSRPQPQLTVSA